MVKNVLEVINFVGEFVLNLKEFDQKEIIKEIEEIKKRIEDVEEWNLHEVLQLSKKLIGMKNKLNAK